MSTLVVQIPERQRLSARGSAAELRAGTEYAYVSTSDGLTMTGQGECGAALLPERPRSSRVLADTDVSWHRITLPKAPAAPPARGAGGRARGSAAGRRGRGAPRRRARRLGQPADLGGGGRPRTWLRAELAALEKANVFVERIVPASWPDDPPAATSPRRAPTPPTRARRAAAPGRMPMAWPASACRAAGARAGAAPARRRAGAPRRRRRGGRAMAGHAGQRDVARRARVAGRAACGTCASSTSPSAPRRTRVARCAAGS